MNTNKLLTGIIVIALLFRFYILTNSSLTFYSDDAIYASLARFFLEGDFEHFFHPAWQPLYPALSVFAYGLVQNWEGALRLVSAVSGTIIILPLFFLARNFLSTTPTLLFFVATITFFGPTFKISLLPMSDMLATLLLISGITVATVAMGRDSKVKLFLLSSFFFGLAFLTRPEGSMFFFLTLGWTTLYSAYHIFYKRGQAKNLLLLPAMLVVFFLTISPYLVATKIQLGSWTLSQKFSAQVKQWNAFQLRENGTTWSQEVVSIKSPNYRSEYFRGGINHVLEYSDWFIWWFQQKAKNWLNLFNSLFPVWSIPLMGLGAVWALYKNRWQVGYILFFSAIAILASIFSTPLVDPRYLLWTFPIFLLLFYIGVDVFAKIFRKFRDLAPAAAVILSMIFPSFSWSAIISPSAYAREFTNLHTRLEIKVAGEWIKKNSQSDVPRIIMRHEGIEFYANGETIYTPQDLTYEKTIAYARENNADYLVAWTEELASDKNLSFLLEEGRKSPGLKEAVRFKEGSRVLVIYAFQD